MGESTEHGVIFAVERTPDRLDPVVEFIDEEDDEVPEIGIHREFAVKRVRRDRLVVGWMVHG